MKNFTLIISLLLLTFCSSVNAQHWSKHGIGATATGICIVDLSVPSDNVAWGILSVFSAGSCGGIVPYVCRTTNGNAWLTSPITLGPDVTPVCISAVSTSTAWLAATNIGSNTTGEIYKTTNGGSTWTLQQTASFVDAVRFIHFYDVNEGVAVGDSSIYRTTDGGTHWNFIGSLPVPSAFIGSGSTIFLLNSYEVLDNTIWLGDSWGYFYKSYDRGLTWECLANPIYPSAVKGIAFRDQNYGIAVAAQYIGGGSGSSGGSYADYSVYTTDGGNSWLPMPINFSSSTVVNSTAKYDVAYVPGTANTFVVTSEFDPSYAAFSCITTDGGATWSLLDSTEQHTVCVFTSPNNGYSGGYISNFSSGIFRWTGNLPTALNEIQEEKNLNIYPNPVNDLLHIKNNFISQQTTISITDLSGKEVLIENKSFGEDEIKIDVNHLAKGAYLLHIKSGNNQELNAKFLH